MVSRTTAIRTSALAGSAALVGVDTVGVVSGEPQPDVIAK